MSTERARRLLSVEEYLAAEEISSGKHEFLGGEVYAMTGASVRHNTIAANIVMAVGVRLKGKPCRVFVSDMKIRLKFPTHMRFYYADASIVCHSNPPEEAFQDHPVILFEVLSRRTRRLDEGEKKDAYLTIPSLAVYALVEQELPLITCFRRTDQGFVRELCKGLDAELSLHEAGVLLPLSEIYDRVDFFPEPGDEDL